MFFFLPALSFVASQHAGLYLIDCLVLLLIAFKKGRVFFNRNVMLTLSIFAILLILSILLSMVKGFQIRMQGMGFFYKYLFPFLIVALLRTYSEKITFKYFTKIWLFSGLLLASWTLLYPILVASGAIYGTMRPSFPFSDDFRFSDAHLLSYVLAIYFCGTLYLQKWAREPVKFNIILILEFVAMISTGSRTGLTLSILFILLTGFFSLMMKFDNSAFKVNKRIIVLILICSIAFPYVINNYLDASLVARAINLDVFNDASSSARIKLFYISLNEAWNGFPFSSGPLSSEAIFYDGIHSILIAHFGLFGFVCIVLLVGIYLINLFRLDIHLGIFALVFFLGLLITEYVLVSRGAFSLFFFLTCIQLMIRANNTEENCV